MTAEQTPLCDLQKKRHFHGLTLTPSQNRVLNFFFGATVIGTFLAMLGIILYYVYAFASLSNGSREFNWLLGIFSDFVAIMDASLHESPYLDAGASYPPFAIALLTPFAWICQNVFATYANRVLTVDELTARVIRHPEFWVAFLLFFTLCSFAVIALILFKYRPDRITSLKIAIIILLSTPFVYAIMRANTIYFALILLLAFLLLYDHKNAFLREVSYICLALSGMIKIYPLFFGVFLLRKKKWFASVRVALYFFVGTFLSFFLFQEGLENFSPFLHQLGNFMQENERLLTGKNLSITSLLYKIFSWFVPDQAGAVLFHSINFTLLIIIMLFAAFCAVLASSDFSRSAISAAVVLLIPTVSYFYILVFTVIPFMEFIKHYDTFSRRKQRLYTLLFLILFFTPLILPKNFLLQSLAVMVMFGTECAGVIKNDIPELLSARRSQPFEVSK